MPLTTLPACASSARLGRRYLGDHWTVAVARSPAVRAHGHHVRTLVIGLRIQMMTAVITGSPPRLIRSISRQGVIFILRLRNCGAPALSDRAPAQIPALRVARPGMLSLVPDGAIRHARADREVTMCKIVAGLAITLDGVVEAPSRNRMRCDDEKGEVIGARIAQADAILLGPGSTWSSPSYDRSWAATCRWPTS
jgi:hypothetical protein